MALNSYSKQFSLIKEDVRQTTNKITRDLAKTAKRDLEIASHNIISHYYDSYVPEYYVRTHNLYNMFVKPKLKENVENGHKASVYADANAMFDNYHITKDAVFETVWNRGHRGIEDLQTGAYTQNLTPTWHPTINYMGYQKVDKTPHILMCEFLKNWGKSFGEKRIDGIADKYKGKEIKEFPGSVSVMHRYR